ncbi:hypothetical protein BJ166DRAFT_532036 [Pestalotiopsis sp. NC0098]|nr:hypothetical protein BJ166DRAFT_532036 [Pestalotiopsis sp. NC0098]
MLRCLAIHENSMRSARSRTETENDSSPETKSKHAYTPGARTPPPAGGPDQGEARDTTRYGRCAYHEEGSKNIPDSCYRRTDCSACLGGHPAQPRSLSPTKVATIHAQATHTARSWRLWTEESAFGCFLHGKKFDRSRAKEKKRQIKAVSTIGKITQKRLRLSWRSECRRANSRQGHWATTPCGGRLSPFIPGWRASFCIPHT